MHSTLLFSLLAAEGEPPTFDPFPGSLEPFNVVVLTVLAILLLWWLLRLQAGQVEPVEVGHHDDHGHNHGHAEPHQAAMHAPPPTAEIEAPSAPATTGMEPPEPDDLKKLEGIGPKVEGVLNAAGIETYAQLAAAGADRLQGILDAADYQYMDPASWPEQARLAAAGEWEALQKLQDELTAGKE